MDSLLTPLNFSVYYTSTFLYDYHGSIYTKTDGKAMGSPHSPTLSNFYMAMLEKKMFNNFAKAYMINILIFSYY